MTFTIFAEDGLKLALGATMKSQIGTSSIRTRFPVVDHGRSRTGDYRTSRPSWRANRDAQNVEEGPAPAILCLLPVLQAERSSLRPLQKSQPPPEVRTPRLLALEPKDRARLLLGMGSDPRQPIRRSRAGTCSSHWQLTTRPEVPHRLGGLVLWLRRPVRRLPC